MLKGGWHTVLNIFNGLVDVPRFSVLLFRVCVLIATGDARASRGFIRQPQKIQQPGDAPTISPVSKNMFDAVQYQTFRV